MSTSLPEGWTLRDFSDTGTVYDGPHATPTRINTGPFFLNISALQSGRLVLDACDHVSDEDYLQWTRRVTPRSGDLLFSYETRLGDAALMPDNVTACLGRRMALCRPNLNCVVPRFLLYAYLGPEFQRQIDVNAIRGATVNRIALTEIGRWPIALPPLWEQEAIAEVLGSLDDKIEANLETAENLGAIRATEYAYSLAAGSSAQQLSTLTQLISRGKAPKYVQEDGTTVLNQKCIRDERVILEHARLTETKRLDSQRSLSGGDILVNSTGVGTLGRVAVWNDTGVVTVDSHVTIVRADPSRVNPWVLGEAVIAGQRRIEAMAEGSTGQTELSKSTLGTLEVLVPTSDGLGEMIRCCRDLETQLQKENRVLAELRDTLLGPLVSGRLRVKDAEKMVGDVL